MKRIDWCHVLVRTSVRARLRGSMPPRAWEWPPVTHSGGVCWNPSPQDAPSISELTPAHYMAALHLAPLHTSAKSSTTHWACYGNCPLLVCAPGTSSLAVSKYLLVGVHTFGITFSGIKRGLASWLEAFWHLLQKVSARVWR